MMKLLGVAEPPAIAKVFLDLLFLHFPWRKSEGWRVARPPAIAQMQSKKRFTEI